MKRMLCGLVLVAACGASSNPTPTTPPPVDPVPMTEGSATPPPADPVVPVTPVEPAEPPPPDPATIKANLLAAEMAAFDKAKPVFEKWCAKCHSKTGKKQSAGKRNHFDMTTYPFGGHHAMDIHNEIRASLGLTGKKPTMPADKKGAVTGDDLERIKAWIDAFEASHQGGAHEEHDAHGGGHKH